MKRCRRGEKLLILKGERKGRLEEEGKGSEEGQKGRSIC